MTPHEREVAIAWALFLTLLIGGAVALVALAWCLHEDPTLLAPEEP